MYKKDFLIKVKEKHGERYNYDLVPIKFNTHDVIKIKCYKHGIYTQKAYTHLYGGKCRQCSDEDKIMSTEHFIKKSMAIHKDKYDYSKSIYKGNDEYVTIICPKHGEFKQKPILHYKGNNCYKCSLETLSEKNRMPYNVYLSKVQELHKNKFKYPNLNYKNKDDEIDIICPVHGLFKQRASVHMLGFGCKKCSTKSRGENTINNILSSKNIKYVEQYSIEEYKRFKYDFYLLDYNLLIEYDGRQHFKHDSWGGDKELKNIQKRDAIKNVLAKNNNYKLLRISYKDYNKIEDIIMEKIEEIKNENKLVEYTAVVYTDGSSNPNPGFYASGVHGYLYTDNDIKEKINDAPNGYITCTKGYVKIDLAKNLTKVLPSFYFNGLYCFPAIGTNNMAEARAITISLQKLLESDFNIKKIYIKTDSSYAKGIFDKILMDEYNYDELKDRPNSDIWYDAVDLLKELAKNNIELEMIKVLGHSDVLGNILTDSLANLARYNAEIGNVGNFFKITPNQKYWKPNIKKEPLLNVKSLFFNHTDRELNPYRYVIMDYNTTNEIGTNDNSALFGLVYTKGQFEDIEYILDLDKKLCRHHYTLSELNMSTFYSQEYNYFKEHFGDMVFKPNRRESGFDIFDLPLTYSTFQGLAKVAFNRTLELEKTYKDYIIFKSGETLENNEFIDITHLIYKDNDKGKRTCFLDQNEKFLNYNYQHNGKDVKVTLSVGTELPTRNILKNIEKDVRNVYLEIVKKDKILQTNVVIVTDDIIGVYTNFFTRNIITK